MIVYVIPFLFLELYVSLKVGENIGFFMSALWIVSSIFIGVYLIKSSSMTLLSSLNQVRVGKMNMQGFKNTASSYLLGAVLLIVPGVLSDTLGVFSLLYALYLQFTAKIIPANKTNHNKQGKDNVIDVEIIE